MEANKNLAVFYASMTHVLEGNRQTIAESMNCVVAYEIECPVSNMKVDQRAVSKNEARSRLSNLEIASSICPDAYDCLPIIEKYSPVEQFDDYMTQEFEHESTVPLNSPRSDSEE